MSIYYCSITGEPCEVPVASKKSGHVYEKRVIEKYIDANGNDPVTNQPIGKEDLIELQGTNLKSERLNLLSQQSHKASPFERKQHSRLNHSFSK